MSCGCICAICYEDVDPASELLQVIALCGHVFHELCLQQWIEFCPNGRAPTCPLCKQNCAAKDVHRLFFQSVSDSARTKKDGTNHEQPSQRKCPSDRDQLSQEDQSKIWRLEAKVTMLTAECNVSKEKILQVEGEQQRHIEQLRVLEAEKVKARKEKGQLVESLARTREDLGRTSKHFEELVGQNEAMAKDLAVYKLATDVNLSEVDMSRLISPPNRSASKEDIIDTMTKALFLQNRAFKDLMHKCQELGMGESRAEQKSEKLMQQVKRLKTRMQELARAEEDKENAQVRSLTRTSKPHRISAGSSALNSSHFANSLENIPSLSLSHPKPRKAVSSNEAASPPLAPVPTDVICLDDDTNAQVRGTKVTRPALVIDSSEMVPAAQRNDGVFSPTRKSPRTTSQPDYGAILAESHPQSLGDETGEDSAVRTAFGPWSEEDGFYLDVGSSGPRERPKLTIGLDGDIDNVDALRRRPMFPIRQELGLGQGLTSFTRPQSATGYQMPAIADQAAGPLDSTFILSGADGRGGRVRVLKPPRLFAGGVGSSNTLGVMRGKRFKPTSHIAGARPSTLRIEHFFGRG